MKEKSWWGQNEDVEGAGRLEDEEGEVVSDRSENQGYDGLSLTI